MRARTWTPAEDNRLAEAMAAGGGWALVASKVRREIGPCRRRAQRLGVKLNNDGLTERQRVGNAASWTPERRKMQSDLTRATEIWRLGNAALASRPDVIARRGASVKAARAKWWDWCPVEYRAEYRKMVNIIGAAAARADTERMIARDAARREAAAIKAARPRRLSFDELMAKIASGAPVTLTERVFLPTRDLAFSPSGCALA